jgi:hypothetical protein
MNGLWAVPTTQKLKNKSQARRPLRAAAFFCGISVGAGLVPALLRTASIKDARKKGNHKGCL